MPIGFPSSPTTGQEWPTVDPRWEWDGAKWVALPPGTPVTTIKPTPVGADRLILLDSAASFAPVLATLSSLPGGGGGGAGALVTVTHNGGGANPVTGDTLTAAFAAGYTGSVQWQRNGVNIGGATNPTYMAVLADEGTTVRPQVTSLIYTATGLPVGAGATAPAAMTVGQWTAEATVVAGEMGINIVTLPSNGGSAITALEYRVGAGAAIALTGTGTGLRTVTAGFSAGVAVDVQVRAVNAIGAGAWSDTKNRTPLAGGGGTATYQTEARTTGNIRQTVGITATKPTGTVATDLLVAFLEPNEQLRLQDMAPPTGWTLRGEVYSDFSNATGTRVWTAAGDVTDMLFRMATNDAWTGSAMHVFRVSGVNLSNPVRQIATRAAQDWTPAVANMPTPEVTAGDGDCVLSAYFQLQSNTAVGTPTAGYTRVVDLDNTFNRYSVVHQSDIAPGATGEISHAAGAVASQGRVGFTLALRAA